jgi:hypothetical protein
MSLRVLKELFKKQNSSKSKENGNHQIQGFDFGKVVIFMRRNALKQLVL